jgi:hypothetical protein
VVIYSSSSLHEYLSNAWISSTGTVLLIHEFLSMGHEVTKGKEDFLEKNQEIAYNISLTFFILISNTILLKWEDILCTQNVYTTLP